jgi:bifunctional DNase/RNase
MSNWCGTSRERKAAMLMEVKASSVSYCPVHHMNVLILKGKTEELWLPVFIRDEDGGILKALLQRTAVAPLRGVKDVLGEMKGSIFSVILHDHPRHPFLATIKLSTGHRRPVEVEVPYTEAIALGIQTGAPIFIDRNIVKQAPAIVQGENATVRTDLKDYLDSQMRPKKSREVLQGQLKDAIRSEDFELAAIIKEELKILSEASTEKGQ